MLAAALDPQRESCDFQTVGPLGHCRMAENCKSLAALTLQACRRVRLQDQHSARGSQFLRKSSPPLAAIFPVLRRRLGQFEVPDDGSGRASG